MCNSTTLTEELKNSLARCKPPGYILSEMLDVPEEDLHLEIRQQEGQNGISVQLWRRGELTPSWTRPGRSLLAEFRLSNVTATSLFLSHGAWVRDTLRRKGLGDLLLRWRMSAIKNCYESGDCSTPDGMIATVNTYNYAQNHLMEKHGWKKVDVQTGHAVMWSWRKQQWR